MAGHALGAAHQSAFAGKKTVNRYRLIHVALQCRSCMGVDIVYVVGLDACVVEGACHRYNASSVTGLRNAAAIAREAVTHDFGEDGCSASHSVVIVFEHECCRAAARDESVAVAVKWARGLGGFVHAYRECSQRVERRHRVVVGLLRSAA